MSADLAEQLAHLTPAPPLWHSPQTTPSGCIYHAAFALLGDTGLLLHVGDASAGAWIARLAERGVAPYHLHHARWDPDGQPLSRRGWEVLRSQAQRQRVTAFPLLVSIPSTRWQGHHLVAIHLPHRAIDQVRISDSVTPGLQTLSWAEFLDSPYAQAWEVEQLVSLDPDAHPPETAPLVPLETP